MLDELYLSEPEESECKKIIDSLHTHNQKIDHLLWRLKYEIFDDGLKKSQKFGSFDQICARLHEEEGFLAPSTCHERAWAYNERIIINDKFQIDISNIKLSVTTLLELRKTKNLETKRQTLKMALKICRNNKVTAEDIENARKLVAPSLREPEKLLSQFVHQTTQSSGEKTDYLYVDGAPGNYDGEDCTDFEKAIPDREVLEFTVLDRTTKVDSNAAPEERAVHNQGIQFYPNSRIYEWKGLRFRSKAEIAIAHALDGFSVLYLPNCLARLNDPGKPNSRVNKEADFLVCYQGKLGILEVDGPYHTPDRRVEEQERERLFRLQGVRIVERYDSTRCLEQPFDVVREFLQLLR
ncbi:hypothetical protein NIES37_73080 (plasmid) [Tolypothrix tenuis PCC 7101]|uniref:DUF559 domain-containing protein n=1 Tax=Tolypothrix tenuis PCC 7101 TaxID=231146 RepID=A0A1Z4NC76_9CYAN|nr:hypothetical protein NIES37_73080 [Tolypothrix tenuis PCC 7101]BAZ78646.1 hypothetical protein NIES50_72790 [Aulosira laxa NIES-50]